MSEQAEERLGETLLGLRPALRCDPADEGIGANSIHIRATGIHIQSIAIHSRAIAADIRATSIYIRATAADSREIGIYSQEIASYSREIAADSQEMAVNIEEIAGYARRSAAAAVGRLRAAGLAPVSDRNPSFLPFGACRALNTLRP